MRDALWTVIGSLLTAGLLTSCSRQSASGHPNATVADATGPSWTPQINVGKPASRPNVPVEVVWIPGGSFWMGSDEPNMPDARPFHRVYVDGFWMNQTEVTNEQFSRFVASTTYVTLAERKPRAEDFPGASPENLVAGSVVFSPPAHAVPLNNHFAWWSYVAGANWKHPEGPQSDVKSRKNHPVVHIAYQDAAAYCAWSDARLPTEAEFEFAARGGLSCNWRNARGRQRLSSAVPSYGQAEQTNDHAGATAAHGGITLGVWLK